MAQAVGEPSDPGTVDHIVQGLAVGREQAQEIWEMGGGPVTGDVALGKANVPGLEGGLEGLPVVQVQAEVGALAIAHGLHAAVGQTDGERSVAQLLEQSKHGACRCRGAFGQLQSLACGHNIHEKPLFVLDKFILWVVCPVFNAFGH